MLVSCERGSKINILQNQPDIVGRVIEKAFEYDNVHLLSEVVQPVYQEVCEFFRWKRAFWDDLNRPSQAVT